MMQGLFSDVPLIGVLSLLHETEQTGVLDVDAEVPFTVAFARGQVVEGGILDWTGLDALHASPMLPESGSFSYMRRDVTGAAISPFEQFTTNWARISDEWEQIGAVISSPSVVLSGPMPLFDQDKGRSVRAAARDAGLPLFEVAARAADAVEAGKLRPTGRYAWYGLRLTHQGQRQSALARALTGNLNLGEIVERGFSPSEVRAYLMAEIRMGLRFSGSGWVLRDLIWETQRETHASSDFML
ncbi:DUF4388 domain-containing protein [Deinococcus alpinitundrae]|uniref:DUF4388 domain-containing protein n=1 Tax=Deinococcus alpinitundrae TaxID=468913 RepID=UPI001ED8EBDB|nr:DUF4388 domain-containing protein [Deinococcus alpinitundrae]